jgi:ABC-2 type transport system ATP-binding protein
MLSGLSKPTSGNASILGFDIRSEIINIKKRIGVVPEISNPYYELSGFDNLLFMAQLYGVPLAQRRKKAEELLKTFRLYEHKDSLFRTFSRGMKRELTIAAAVVINFELRLGSLERLLLAPVSLSAVLLGKVLGGVLFSVL